MSFGPVGSSHDWQNLPAVASGAFTTNASTEASAEAILKGGSLHGKTSASGRHAQDGFVTV